MDMGTACWWPQDPDWLPWEYPAVPEYRNTLSLPFNDLAAVETAFNAFGKDIAAIIVEPVPGNMGVVIPEEGFLQGLRDITRQNGSLLIFDEVITGFRLSQGGAQKHYGILPDMTTLGKIIGGGLPVGAFGGSKEIMSQMAPDGAIYQAGTLSGNPLAMAAGLATLRILRQGDIYDRLEQSAQLLFSGLESAAEEAGIPVAINRLGSMGSLFFSNSPVSDFETAKKSDGDLFKRYYGLMLERGIYLAPSPFETTFVSLAHDEEVIKKTVEIAASAFGSL